MLYTKDSSLTKYVVHAEHVITYLGNTPEAITRLTQSGFAADRLSEGQTLVNQVKEAFHELDNFLLQQKAATESFNSEWKKLTALHQVHLQAARRCLKSEAAHLLQIRPQNYAGWASIVERFYAAILGNVEYQAKLNELSIATEELLRANQLLTNLIASKAEQNQRRYDHLAIKQRRDEKFNILKRWFDGLLALARVAFRQESVMSQMVRPLSTPLSKEAKEKLKAQKEQKKAAKSKKSAQPASEATAPVSQPTEAPNEPAGQSSAPVSDNASSLM